ncbi:hypothetical protein [Sphingopyxis sp. MWB1]|uniref:hypothetical protein n=1 Tax=Sphingopyxis sp. MWB1 TaxID=1537715 RepID=UPI000B1FFCE7|nr:hypothetical protein [Sphingopyxis sp. MWB1]
MASTGTLKPKLFFGWLTGLCLAVLAFSQAAASIGLVIDGFRPLGAGFFSWRTGQMRLSMKVFESRDKKSAESAISFGRSTLKLAPLTPRSLWLIGRGLEINGNLADARRAMSQAERISRRDGAVELWLGADNLRRGEIVAGLRNFDLMIRGDRDAGSQIMPRLSMVILAPEGRRHLMPYISENNPWLRDLMRAAVSHLPRAEPIATLLIDRGKKAPHVDTLYPIYSELMKRLIAERAYRQALQLHPLLPGAGSSSLRDVGVVGDGAPSDGYPPFIWDFPDSSDRGGNVVGVEGGGGLDLFGSPGTVGIAAGKIVLPQGADTFRWRIDDRAMNLQSGAVWEMTCLMGKAGGTVRRSVNLLEDGVPLGSAMAMPIPEGCGLLRVEMRIAGGIGRGPATITVSELKMTSGEQKQ